MGGEGGKGGKRYRKGNTWKRSHFRFFHLLGNQLCLDQHNLITKAHNCPCWTYHALGSHLHTVNIYRHLGHWRGKTRFSRRANMDITYCNGKVLHITNASCSETCLKFSFALFHITGGSTAGLWCFREELPYMLLWEENLDFATTATSVILSLSKFFIKMRV